jgi:hypothetical protein
MNTKPINDGGSAFPFGQISELTGQPINGFFEPGMTLRDWFAGQALSGMMANSYYHESGIVPIKDCYHFADAMIAEREKGVKP